ncbi:Protein ASI1 [Fusarium oxysporum f. sp. albedinis]|nr:Protein ASI1 [Fusarium oxysporum f. sp. albedinis]
MVAKPLRFPTGVFRCDRNIENSDIVYKTENIGECIPQPSGALGSVSRVKGSGVHGERTWSHRAAWGCQHDTSISSLIW